MRYRGHGAIELNGERVAEADYVATLRASGGHRKWFIDFTSLDGELGPHEIYTLDLRERVRLTLGSMALPDGSTKVVVLDGMTTRSGHPARAGERAVEGSPHS